MTGSSTPSGLQWIEGKFGSGHWCEGKTCLICGGTPASENDAGELRETIEADAFHAMRAFCEDTDNVEFQPRLLGLVDNLLERAFAALRQNRPERPSTTALPPLGAPVSTKPKYPCPNGKECIDTMACERSGKCERERGVTWDQNDSPSSSNDKSSEPVAWAITFQGLFNRNIHLDEGEARIALDNLNHSHPDGIRRLVPLYAVVPSSATQTSTMPRVEKALGHAHFLKGYAVNLPDDPEVMKAALAIIDALRACPDREGACRDMLTVHIKQSGAMKILHRAVGIVIFPACFVVTFFLAGSVFAWYTARDQFKNYWHWPEKWRER